MKAFLNRIDGLDDAIITMYLSKRNLTRQLEMEIRHEVMKNSACSAFDVFSDVHDDVTVPMGTLLHMTPKLRDYLEKLFKWGTQHMTMLRFIDLSFSVYGLHRGGQDDVDAHAYRMHNRVIRASTRMGDVHTGEMSEFYQGKIIPTDVALIQLGIDTPNEITVDGKTYVKATNGYILKGHENDRDYKRGLYMMSWPSDFIFRIPLVEFAHVYKLRNKHGTANPEVKQCIESCTDQLITAMDGFVTRELLEAIPN